MTDAENPPAPTPTPEATPAEPTRRFSVPWKKHSTDEPAAELAEKDADAQMGCPPAWINCGLVKKKEATPKEEAASKNEAGPAEEAQPENDAREEDGDTEDDVEAQKGCIRGGGGGNKAQYGSGKSMMEEFRDFLLGGNLIRIAVAFVLALSLERLITAFVGAFITPILGIIGSTDFEDLTFEIRDSTFTYGKFLDALIGFLVIAIVLFFVLILPVQRYGGKCVPAWIMRKCPFCFQDMPAIGTKCPHCCSNIEPLPIGKTE